MFAGVDRLDRGCFAELDEVVVLHVSDGV